MNFSGFSPSKQLHYAPMLHRLLHLTLFLGFCLGGFRGLVAGENLADLEAFKPNKTLKEKIITFGSNAESAERSAMIRSWKVSRNGVFKVKNISLGAVDGEDFCILDIEHRIYEPPDTTRVQEMVVGYGRTPNAALESARVRAMQRIRDNPRSRPNLRSSSLPISSEQYLPMPKEDERDFIESHIRFWGNGNNWRVYLKFDYLEMK